MLNKKQQESNKSTALDSSWFRSTVPDDSSLNGREKRWREGLWSERMRMRK